MPKPLRVSGPSSAPAVPDKSAEVAAAEVAVQLYDDEYARLQQMQDTFTQNFPDAVAALDELRQQEDVVMDTIQRAHPLVQAAKQDIGDFTCQRKWKSEHYDDGDFTKLAAKLDPHELHQLLKSGHIKKISLAKSAVGYFAQHPTESEIVQSAWRKREEMTPAVTTPKI